MYEYKVITNFSLSRNKLATKLENEINTLATEGWKLSSHVVSDGISYLIMERKIDDLLEHYEDENSF